MNLLSDSKEPGKQMETTQPEENLAKPSGRLFAVDALRGLIIILMALDHANLFVAHKHSSGEYWGSGFPAYYDSLAFMTRFVTHLSAPGFFFLMGTGIFLYAQARRERGWGKWAIMRHFLIRGVVLIALQVLVVNRAWELSGDGWPTIYVGVLFALGSAMILSSLLLWIKPVFLLVIAIGLLISSEFLVPAPELWGTFQFSNINDYIKFVWIFPGGNANLWSNYPILPWLNLVIFGMLFGRWLIKDQEQAYNSAMIIGSGLLAAFIVIRSLDGYGNILPRMGNTWIDYLNLVKYPPSITFILLTMGLNLILLSAFSKAGQKLRKFFYPLVVFGRVPLFFYIVHLFLYAGLGLWLAPGGTSLALMYPYWLLGLLILFPVCLMYRRLKELHTANLVLRYL